MKEYPMLIEYPLDISAALSYARRWAYGRNPAYYDFDPIGGDCTNFISQCIFAAGAVMNFTPDIGWYYISLNDRAAAWTGVDFFARFILTNTGAGPFGRLVSRQELRAGDVVQLGNSQRFYHTLLVTGTQSGEVLVAAHSRDVYGAKLSAFSFTQLRCIRIGGARKYT